MKNLQVLLDFQPVQGNAPAMPCNYCGKNFRPKYMATLHPFEERSSEYSIAICSDLCKEKFLSPKISETVSDMLIETVCKISEQTDTSVNTEWHGYIQAFSQKNGMVTKETRG